MGADLSEDDDDLGSNQPKPLPPLTYKLKELEDDDPALAAAPVESPLTRANSVSRYFFVPASQFGGTNGVGGGFKSFVPLQGATEVLPQSSKNERITLNFPLSWRRSSL